MPSMHNARADLPGATWRKSGRSGAQGNCVELAPVSAGETAVRNSRFPEGPALLFPVEEWAAFLAGIKDGEFDDLMRDGQAS